jgi:hypothetical protein
LALYPGRTSCGRLSGRSRIGTVRRSLSFDGSQVAVAFRGDRGLEHNSRRQTRRAYKLRSPFGAIEDWNTFFTLFYWIVKLRSPFGAIEDWNNLACSDGLPSYWLRSPFGAIEDWNCIFASRSTAASRVAVAFRGDRGLENNWSGAMATIPKISIRLRSCGAERTEG